MKYSHLNKLAIVGVSTFLFLVAGFTFAQTWNNPPANPPAQNTPTPISEWDEPKQRRKSWYWPYPSRFTPT